MLKKLIAALAAALMMVTIPLTALAAPDDTPAPADPAPTIDPAVFADHVKELVQQVVALKSQLAQERQLDQSIISDIRSLKGIYTPDPAQHKAFNSEMKPLEQQLKKLQRNLEKAQKGRVVNKGKKAGTTVVDQNRVDSLKQQIADTQAKIDALNAKYPGLQQQLKANRSARSTLKPFRAQLKAEYAKLKPYFEESRTLSEDVRSLEKQLAAAIQAGDLVAAEGIVEKVEADVTKLTADINARIAIREGITKMLQDYKASLTK